MEVGDAVYMVIQDDGETAGDRVVSVHCFEHTATRKAVDLGVELVVQQLRAYGAGGTADDLERGHVHLGDVAAGLGWGVPPAWNVDPEVIGALALLLDDKASSGFRYRTLETVVPQLTDESGSIRVLEHRTRE